MKERINSKFFAKYTYIIIFFNISNLNNNKTMKFNLIFLVVLLLCSLSLEMKSKMKKTRGTVEHYGSCSQDSDCVSPYKCFLRMCRETRCRIFKMRKSCKALDPEPIF